MPELNKYVEAQHFFCDRPTTLGFGLKNKNKKTKNLKSEFSLCSEAAWWIWRSKPVGKTQQQAGLLGPISELSILAGGRRMLSIFT